MVFLKFFKKSGIFEKYHFSKFLNSEWVIRLILEKKMIHFEYNLIILISLNHHHHRKKMLHFDNFNNFKILNYPKR